MLYLETRWASLIPFARVVDLLKDVLPVGAALNSETVRNHLQATGERLEQELGDERPPNLFEGAEKDWEQQPLPDGPITVGIDGGYVRAATSRDGLRSSLVRAWWRFGGKRRVRCRLPSVSDSCKPTIRSRTGVYGSC